MNTVPGEPDLFPETKARSGSSWSMSRWLFLISLVLAAHVLLIYFFGRRKPIAPRTVTNVPVLELARNSGEWLALKDPTLFALPNREGFAGLAWLTPPPLHVHMPDLTEGPKWLELSNTELGNVFSRFMQTNHFTTYHFEMKLPAQITEPEIPVAPAFAQKSNVRVEGDLAKRPMQTALKPPSLSYNGVLKPSKVQVLVNAQGEVISAVLLGSSGYDAANQQALKLARTARFAPAPGMVVGKLIFDWHTIAPPTNTITSPVQ